MIQWISRFLEKLRNDKNLCLICNKNAGKNPAIVQYKYEGGLGEAFLCDKCDDSMNKTKMEDIYE